MAPEPTALTQPAPIDEFPGDPSNWALFLDLDGTLIDIAAAPDAVRVPVDLGPLLGLVSRHLNGAVAIVTGRLLSDLDALFAPLRLPAAGLHGMEWRIRGDAEITVAQAENVDAVRGAVAKIAASRPGVLLEDKGKALALHYRHAPEQQADLTQEIGILLASHPALKALPGKMVLEIKPAEVSKYTAVRQLMRHPPFLGRVPVFVGDDVTDQDGFRAALEAGGLAVAVAERPDEAASLTLAAPMAVRDWLARLAKRLEQEIAPEAQARGASI
ncbi:MAG: otsB [Alphaproteobacteria bacterium]|nr:otsB [Alphaproteobacteria bacterium]